MGSIFLGAADALRRKRRCPKCGKEQVVPREKRRETVRCIACGADVPPPKK
jgi:ribosomal protein S27E